MGSQFCRQHVFLSLGGDFLWIKNEAALLQLRIFAVCVPLLTLGSRTPWSATPMLNSIGSCQNGHMRLAAMAVTTKSFCMWILFRSSPCNLPHLDGIS